MIDRSLSNSFDPLVEGIGFVVVIVLVVMLLAVAANRTGPDVTKTVVLDRAAWRCTSEHSERVAIEQPEGETSYQTTQVCDAWGRV